MRLLLDKGASVDLQDSHGNTALVHAALRRQRGYGFVDDYTQILTDLLGAGARDNIPNREGRSANTIMNPITVWESQSKSKRAFSLGGDLGSRGFLRYEYTTPSL